MKQSKEAWEGSYYNKFDIVRSLINLFRYICQHVNVSCTAQVITKTFHHFEEEESHEFMIHLGRLQNDLRLEGSPIILTSRVRDHQSIRSRHVTIVLTQAGSTPVAVVVYLLWATPIRCIIHQSIRKRHVTIVLTHSGSTPVAVVVYLLWATPICCMI